MTEEKQQSDGGASLAVRLVAGVLAFWGLAYGFDHFAQPSLHIDLRSEQLQAQQFANAAIAETGAQIY